MTPEQIAKAGTEHAEQAALFCWAATCKYKSDLMWLHAIPNGGARDRVTASRMKAEGVKAGVVDIFLPMPVTWEQSFEGYETTVSKTYHGLYLEMKKKGREKESHGGLSEKQIAFLLCMEQRGYCTRVAYGWEQAREIIIKYLHLSD